MHEKQRKILFGVLLAVTFAVILFFNHYSPMMTDDFNYGAEVKRASSLSDLIVQEINQYHSWTGRSVAHLTLRIFLFLPVPVFKVANALAYMALSLLLYANVRNRKKVDWMLFLFLQLGLWLFTVDFYQTFLWETGACNYLWGAFWIFFFLTLVRKYSALVQETAQKKEEIPKGNTIAVAAGLLLLGIVAGWCNENTSGASLLVVLYLLIRNLRGTTGRQAQRGFITNLPLLTAAIGNAIGLYLMVSAPGNFIRASYREEAHTGLVAIAARFLKITLHIRQYFFWLLVVFVVLTVIRLLQNVRQEKKERWKAVKLPFLWFCLFLITSYALILTTDPQPRALFGGGLFLLLAVLQEITDAIAEEKQSIHTDRFGIRALLYSALAVGTLYLGFVILDCGADNMRVYRDVSNRIAYLEEQKTAGSTDITLPMVHEAFLNDYSMTVDMDLGEDPGFWTNAAYEDFFDVPVIRALPYDDWAVSVGLETPEEAEVSKKLSETDQTEKKIKPIPGL